MAKFAAFHDAYKMFVEYTNYKKPLTYDEWRLKPDDIKAALLYVQFYSEITLAWEKADSLKVGDDAEGVTTVLQYLEKQVRQTQYFHKDNPEKKATAEFRRLHPDQCIAVERRIIDANPEKFSAAYIYRTAYNCLYCIAGHDRQCDKDRINNEMSAIIECDGDEIDLFDTVSDVKGSAESQFENDSFEKEFWSIIEDVGLPAQKVMRYLLSSTTDAEGNTIHDPATLKKLSSRNKLYKLDPLRDVEVSIESVDEIVNQIKERFLSVPMNSVCGQFITQMLAVE